MAVSHFTLSLKCPAPARCRLPFNAHLVFAASEAASATRRTLSSGDVDPLLRPRIAAALRELEAASHALREYDRLADEPDARCDLAVDRLCATFEALRSLARARWVFPDPGYRLGPRARRRDLENWHQHFRASAMVLRLQGYARLRGVARAAATAVSAEAAQARETGHAAQAEAHLRLAESIVLRTRSADAARFGLGDQHQQFAARLCGFRRQLYCATQRLDALRAAAEPAEVHAIDLTGYERDGLDAGFYRSAFAASHDGE